MANVGYVELLRRNRSFRWVWLAEVVSLTGDWFTTIALFAMLLELTGRGESVGFALVARFLPQLLFGPLSGVLADRLPRRTIMIACDLGRAVVVLGFLLVHDAGDVWLVYALTYVQLTLTAFFEAAEMAAITSVVAREEIVAANTLQGTTWSAMLAAGAIIGGTVTALVGRTAAFWIDGATFLLSAACVARAVIPHTAPALQRSFHAEGWHAFVDGLRLIRRSGKVAHAILAKAFWGLFAGGAIMLYAVLGERVFPGAGAGGAVTSIGLLYSSRGIGALIGPVVARWTGEDTERALEQRIAASFWLAAVGYVLCGLSPSIGWAALALIVAHMGVSSEWVFSTALINLRVPDEMRGRAFAADMSLFTLGMLTSILVVGRLLDGYGVPPRTLMIGVGVATCVPAVLWPLLGRVMARGQSN